MKKTKKYFDVSRHRSKSKIIIILILLLGLFLRLVALNQSLWLDEAVQAWASSQPSIKWLLFSYLPGDFNPPLYHLLAHFWIKAFGLSEIALRLPSVILGLGTIWLTGAIGQEEKEGLKKKNWPGLTAALLVATSPLHIYYSQEARMYMLAAFGVVFSAWRLLKLKKNNTWANSIWLGLGFLLMGFAHFLTLLTIPVFLLFSGAKWTRSGKAKRRQSQAKIIFPFILLGLGYLIYGPLFWQQLRTGLSWTKIFPVWGQTVGSSGLKSTALLPIKFIIGRISMKNKILYGAISLGLVAVYWGMALMAVFNPQTLFSAKHRRDLRLRFNYPTFILGMLFIPPTLGIIISFWVPVFAYFRFLYLLPFFYLGIAMGGERLGRWGRRGIVLMVGINLVCSGIYLFNPSFHRENWRGTVNWLRQENHLGAPVIILPQIAKPFEYYDSGESQVIYPRPLEQKLPSASMSRDIEIFLVSYGLPIFDPNDKIRNRLKSSHYYLKSGESFRKVGVEKWVKQK